MPSSRAAPPAQRQRGAVERLGARGGLLGAREHGPLLGQHDELGARRGGGAREAVRGLEVAVAVRGRVELHGGGPHGEWLLSLPWIDPSVNPLRRGYRASMRTPPVSAWRGEGGSRSGRPADVPLPPARLPLTRGGRPLKRWRWVGAFSAEAMLCAARARIGGVPVTWWAVWDGERLHERTPPPRRRGADGAAGTCAAAALDLRFEEGEGVEVVSPHGAQYVWTRKQGGIPMRGTVLGRAVRGLRLRRRHGRLPRAPHRPGAGRPASGWPSPARASRGTWSTACTTGRRRSERTVWVDGTPHHVGPLPFADDLSGGRRPALRGRRGRAPAASACSCSPRTTSSRSAASPARCRTPGRSARAGE